MLYFPLILFYPGQLVVKSSFLRWFCFFLLLLSGVCLILIFLFPSPSEFLIRLGFIIYVNAYLMVFNSVFLLFMVFFFFRIFTNINVLILIIHLLFIYGFCQYFLFIFKCLICYSISKKK